MTLIQNPLKLNKTKSVLIALVLWICVVITCWLNGITFESVGINTLMESSFWFCLTLLVSIIPFCMPTTRLKIVFGCLAVPLVCLFLLGTIWSAGWALWFMKTGFNEDHLELDSVSLGSSKVGIYECPDDSGYCSIFVEQSYAIMPGIKKVVTLATTFPASGAKLTKIDKHHVSCHIEIPKDHKQVSDIIATDL